ncbi:hypothetical protein F2P56_032048 [Juglans regia]|uniref:Ninja-family protein n=2 Tax=Juglans regia TaxID=51240 RepID=A0A2I4H214_JUGRE|nr:ninja-family protein 5-like [Juglans regia]KAF5446419.1 hypothetical protein F2P56_032048 [Juglans regia]
MVEVSESTGLKEEDEIELDLGLSIGGSFGKPEKLKPVKKIHVLSVDSKSDGYCVDVTEKHPGFSRSCESPTFAKDAGIVDSQAKRKMHALRRYEAKKKREEKQQQKRGTCRARNGQYRNECQIEEQQPACKKERTDDGMMNVNLNESDDEMKMLLQQQQHRHNDFPNPVPFQALAAMVQYPYAPVQYVPFTNTNGRLGLPCVMPCWAPAGGGLEPSASCRSFRPYKGNQMPGLKLSNGCKLELNGEKDGGNRKTGSYSSPICSSSAGSEERSSSHEGGGSGGSDSRSQSSTQSSPEKLELKGQKANHTKGQSEHSSSSEPVESDAGNINDRTSIPIEKVLHSDTAHQPSPARPMEEAMPETEAKPSDHRHISNAENGNPNYPVKEAKTNMARKPPKPKTGHQNQNTPSLPQMPYVSTTGNGPNGKTITGFLYRYTKSEVSIICVCHGSSFSPAEFVQHAGGTDVSHPLKHITVIPSAFG